MGENNEVKDGKIPLGLCKQAVMKLDSFMSDCHEIMMDPDLDDEERKTFEMITETASLMTAHILSIVSKEMNEETFLGYNVPMDQIDEFGHSDIENDILDTEIE